MKLKELTEEMAVDCEFTVKTIDSVIMRNSTNYSKWVTYMANEEMVYKKCKMECDREYAKLYRSFKWEQEEDITKPEIDIFIKGAETYQNVLAKMEIAKQKVAICEGALKTINALGFSVKNYIEWEKLRQM